VEGLGASHFSLGVDPILTEMKCSFWEVALTDSSRVGGSSRRAVELGKQ